METQVAIGGVSHHYLLQVELPLDLLGVAGVVGDGFGQLGLDVGEPRAQAAHVLIQLLHGHQSLPQLLHSEHNSLRSVSET